MFTRQLSTVAPGLATVEVATGTVQYFEMHTRHRGRHSEASSRIHHVVIDGAGHSFRPRAAQRALSDRLVAFVEAVTRAASQSR